MQETKKQVVIIGGGTGTHTVLSGLKRYQDVLDLTAVVAMTDSGGSTGRLRDEFGYLPVGDVRMALTALASEGNDSDALLRRLFLHRFDRKGGDIGGHNFGNLFLIALTDVLGSEEAAIEAASRVLRISGRVIPITTKKGHLVATYDDGTTVRGEHEIDESTIGDRPRKIKTLSMEPDAWINPRAESALMDADLIILGPGDLYTSVIANCVVGGVADVFSRVRGKVVYVSNLMTKRGQTDGMDVREHVSALASYIGRSPDVVVAHAGAFPDDLLHRYETEFEYPVLCTDGDCGGELIRGDFLTSERITTSRGDVLRRSLLRHDPEKLAAALVKLI